MTIEKKDYTIASVVRALGGAGIPKGSFYQYFDNKHDLYTYTFSQIGDRKKDILEKIQQYVEQLSLRECLVKMLEEAKGFEGEDDRLIQLKDKFINECPQEVKKQVLKNEIPKSYRLLENVLTAYINKGELKKNLDVKKAAYIITSCTVNLENYEFDEGEDIQDIVIRIFDVIIDGFKR